MLSWTIYFYSLNCKVNQRCSVWWVLVTNQPFPSWTGYCVTLYEWFPTARGFHLLTLMLFLSEFVRMNKVFSEVWTETESCSIWIQRVSGQKLCRHAAQYKVYGGGGRPTPTSYPLLHARRVPTLLTSLLLLKLTAGWKISSLTWRWQRGVTVPNLNSDKVAGCSRKKPRMWGGCLCCAALTFRQIHSWFV